MAKQSLLWTALPNGYSDDGKQLRVSVLVSPRLDPENSSAELKSFEDFIDWPETIRQSVFMVRYGVDVAVIQGNKFNGNNRVDKSLGVADSSVWQALLPQDTFVRGFEFKDLKNNVVLSYETHEVTELVRNLYSRLARMTNDQLPELSTILQEPEWNKLITAVERCDKRYVDETGMYDSPKLFKDIVKGFSDIDGLMSDNLAQTLARMQLFHTPPATPEIQKYDSATLDPNDPRKKAQWRTYKRAQLPQSTDFENEIDFHQIVAAMNQYPTLLRKLGLVVDLLINPKEFAPSSQKTLYVDVELPSLSSGAIAQRVRDASPHVNTGLSSDRFEAVTRPNPQLGDFTLKHGLLDLDKKKFDLIQMDVDGSGLKVMNFARSLARQKAPGASLDPITKFEQQTGVPALRNAGLMLVHRNRGSMLYNTFQRASLNNKAIEDFKNPPINSNPKPPKLYAEDLVRGYRVDIWDGNTKVWRSLCQRSAHYMIKDLAPAPSSKLKIKEEEGTVRLAATKSADKTSHQDYIYLHETVMSWSGWSLCVPPPGKAIDKDDKVANAEAERPPGLRMDCKFAAIKNTLPRLRYGRRYWLRARSVDLAGNSLPPNESDYADEQPENNARTYSRYDPVAAPVVALVKSNSNVLQKPDEGESMEQIAIRSFNDQPTDNNIATPHTAERYIVPAQSSVKDAEQHSMLDSGGNVDAATFSMLANQDNTLDEVKLTLSGPLTTSTSEASYAVFVDGTSLPYLPDPLANKVAARIFGHPSFSSHEIISIPLYAGAKKWPNAQPFKVHIYEDINNADPKFDNTSRTLMIPLPKAERITLRLSIMLPKETLKMMGVWNWLSQSDQNDIEPKAINGQHWMLTPWRNINLVHAVQRPLITPTILSIDIDRGLNKTYVYPKFSAHISIKSTDHLDLRAIWNEPRDEVDQTIGKNIERNDHAFSVKITSPDSYAAHYLNPSHTGIPDHHIIGEDKIIVGSYNDWSPVKSHEFNDTRYRRIEYWLEATTSFREYLPTHLIAKEVNNKLVPDDDKIKVVGKKMCTWVKNASPPPAPEILYVVPTFGWVRVEKPAGKSSWRRGGGLRVYLDRPWNVSGYGEMLAVVIPSASFNGDPNIAPSNQPIKNFITQWGNDPIWKSSYVQGSSPKRDHFPLARYEPDTQGKWLPTFAPIEEAGQPPGDFKVTGLTHPSLTATTENAKVEIAPHDVFYDEERQLWYCDIEVDCGTAYYPFIRLALARYQPVSKTNAYLSNIVLADFMALNPDRWLNVTHADGSNVHHITLSGATYSDSSGNQESKKAPVYSLKTPDGESITVSAAKISPTSIVEVWVERLDNSLGEDFGWVREENAVIKRNSKLKRKITFKKKSPSQAKNLMQVQQDMYAYSLQKKRDFSHLLKEDLIEQLIGPPSLWQGSVTLPQTKDSSETRYRIVIAEYEEYLMDDLAPYNNLPTKKGRRLVYVEHVEL